MMTPEEPGTKTHKVEEGSHPISIHIIKWAAHGSNVNDWNYDELDNVETCGHNIEEAKGYITGTIDVGDDWMLLADGLRKDDGTFGNAYSTIEDARRGMEECHAAKVARMRDAIKKCCGIDEEDYRELVESEEIVERTDGNGSFPPSANRVTGSDKGVTFLDTEIAWGSTGYKSTEQHKFICCCDCILTRVTSWIESLELVKS